MKKTDEALDRLARRRRRAEDRLDELRDTLDREFGWAPTAKAWVVPLVGFATGLALAAGLARRKRRPNGE